MQGSNVHAEDPGSARWSPLDPNGMLTAARHAIWILVVIPGCFHPSYDHPRCSPSGECPNGLTCNAQQICEGGGNPLSDAGINPSVDAVPIDAARTCFGGPPLTICLQTAPSAPLTISSTTQINTDNSPMCAALTSGGNYCVLAATTISVEALLRATGTRPLVLVANDSIVVSNTIDVGSHRGATPETGAGADPGAPICIAGTAPGTSGGGAGGSFTGLGGGGGAPIGGIPGAVAGSIAVRGGCAGQDGGGANKGTGGHGGGAVYLIAGSMINVGGAINAAGEGGGGGIINASGGGGAGAGGMIGFDAPMIMGAGLILANGGGGGEGSGTNTAGRAGSDPTTTAAARGGNGGTSGGGDGGGGSASIAAGSGAPGLIATTGAGGGGGGGAAGLVKAPVTATLGTQVSPVATP